MDCLADATARILEIEARQDEVLRELEALERRIDQVLADCQPAALSVAPQVAAPVLKAA